MEELLKKIKDEMVDDLQSTIREYFSDELFDNMPNIYEYAERYMDDASEKEDFGGEDEFDDTVEQLAYDIASLLNSGLEEFLDKFEKDVEEL